MRSIVCCSLASSLRGVRRDVSMLFPLTSNSLRTVTFFDPSRSPPFHIGVLIRILPEGLPYEKNALPDPEAYAAIHEIGVDF